MNILVDRHHAGLLYSLQLLFEDRLGMDLYVPVGARWWDEGYWRFGEVFGDDRLAQQYLYDPAGHRWKFDSLYPLRESKAAWRTSDVEFPERPIYGVELRVAEQMDWWGVMPSVQENQAGFHRFARERGARFLYQVGNAGQQIDWSLDPLALISAEAPIPEGARAVRYHQEFDKDGIFAHHTQDAERHKLASFVNCFSEMPGYHAFTAIERALPEFTFRVHGHWGRDGLIQPTSQVAAAMRTYGFGWHDKPQGDGFGHVLHYWAAIGRPLIGTAAYYHGKLAEPLWEDGATAITLDGREEGDVAARVRELALDPARWASMGAEIRRRLDRLADFGAEEAQIRHLLGLPESS